MHAFNIAKGEMENEAYEKAHGNIKKNHQTPAIEKNDDEVIPKGGLGAFMKASGILAE